TSDAARPAPPPLRCPHCGVENPAHSKFCGGCGKTMASAAPEPASPRPAAAPVERRPLTALFCRLDPQLLADEIDPEDLSSVLPAYQEACAAAIRAEGGQVALAAGEDLLVYFGSPQATEDAPARAVRAGLTLVEAVRYLHDRLPGGPPLRLGVRVAVHTGWVLTGDASGS